MTGKSSYFFHHCESGVENILLYLHKNNDKMKISRLFLYITAAGIMTACGSNVGNDVRNAAGSEAVNDVQSENGVHKMSDYYYTNHVTYGKDTYEYNIVRLADEESGTVADTDGMKYMENTLSLTVTRNGQHIYAHAFSKENIKQYVDEKFLEKSIIEGMAFNRMTEEGLLFAISVGLPLSDEYVQLRLCVHRDGTSTLRRDEIVDENLASDDSLTIVQGAN